MSTHLAIRLDTVLQAVQLPAGVTDLYTGLADVDGDALTHVDRLDYSQGIERNTSEIRAE